MITKDIYMIPCSAEPSSIKKNLRSLLENGLEKRKHPMPTILEGNESHGETSPLPNNRSLSEKISLVPLEDSFPMSPKRKKMLDRLKKS